MIRSAEITDYEAITTIRNTLALDVLRLDDPAYVALVEQRGFLIPTEITYDQFTANLPNYTVAEDKREEVVGFLRVDETQEMTPNEVAHWADPAMEDIYRGMPHANIGKIAVLPEAGQRGLGRELLTEAERRTRARDISHLFCFIVSCKPPTNNASIQFHQRNGFEVAAHIEPQSAYGVEDYLCSLYVKKLLGVPTA